VDDSSVMSNGEDGLLAILKMVVRERGIARNRMEWCRIAARVAITECSDSAAQRRPDGINYVCGVFVYEKDRRNLFVLWV